MEKIVYFLGAGFSAPLGLPVMSDFLVKSKDMFALHPEKYKNFNYVFEKIEKMHIAKSYYNSDLFNIEEILSVLEMHNYLGGIDKSAKFQKYIADVIEYYTSEIEGYNKQWSNSFECLIFGKKRWRDFGHFFCSIFNLQAKLVEYSYPRKEFPHQKQSPRFFLGEKPDAEYAIVTLNYDMIFENILTFIANKCPGSEGLKFNFSLKDDEDRKKEQGAICLAKLHGTIKPLEIVPPTWNKGSNKKLRDSWKLAYNKLKEANQIRILGYSLPESDSYVRYLLKAAVLDAKNLKKIDVICLDPDKNVERSYDDFINFNYYQFKSADIGKYLNDNYQSNYKSNEDNRKKSGSSRIFNAIEENHKKFMERSII